MYVDPTAPSKPVNIRRKIFEFIAKYQDNQDQLPSQDTIRELFGCYTDDVDLHLEQLAREGLLILDRDGGNGITLVPTYTPAPQIKVLGRIANHLEQACGGSCSGSIAIDLRGVGVQMERGMFAVQVLDDRMSDAGIEYGDIALLVASTPMRGDIVAVEEGTALVLRRYIVVAGIPHFLAENPAKPDLRPAWEIKMQGVLWGLVRTVPSSRLAGTATKKNHRKGSLSNPRPRHEARHEVALPKAASPAKPPQRSRTFRAPKKSASPVADTERGKWPEPPFGIELNEFTSSFLLTEEPVDYGPWGECRSQG